MKFEDILPQIREGRKARRTMWDDHYFISMTKSGTIFDCAGDSRVIPGIEMNANDWELVPELVRVADYLVPNLVGDYYHKETYPIGQQPEGAVMVPNSEREESK